MIGYERRKSRAKGRAIELDNTDRRILAALQAEGRISNLDLAERVGLSPTPRGRRVRRLEEAGVIAVYGARVDPAALGLGISVMAIVRLGRQSLEDVRQLLAVIHREPGSGSVCNFRS